jgi:hypothetical protein
VHAESDKYYNLKSRDGLLKRITPGKQTIFLLIDFTSLKKTRFMVEEFVNCLHVAFPDMLTNLDEDRFLLLVRKKSSNEVHINDTRTR